MKRTDQRIVSCSFCDKTQREVRKLVAGPGVYICNECIESCSDMLIDEQRTTAVPQRPKIPTPLEMKTKLDEYVVGQDAAKRVLAVAVYNHYKRINALPVGKRRHTSNNTEDVELSKSNVLLIGPTGSGKTLLAQSLARMLDVPFTVADATSLTEAGYVGEDVENIVQNLLHNAEYDPERAARGIVYIDEVDKIARRGDGPSSTRDVGGEGVQQALLKILEGTKANVSPKGTKRGQQQEVISIDTSNILFICGGAFTGLTDVIRRRVGRKSLGFGAQEAKGEKKDVSALLRLAEPEDLIKFGLIPEFIGRLPGIATLDELNEDDLLDVLTKPKNALVKQYKRLFESDGAKLTFTKEALRMIAKEAVRRKTGARGLRAILEEVMLDVMYDLPFRPDLVECKITEDVVTAKAEPLLTFEKEKKLAS